MKTEDCTKSNVYVWCWSGPGSKSFIFGLFVFLLLLVTALNTFFQWNNLIDQFTSQFLWFFSNLLFWIVFFSTTVFVSVSVFSDQCYTIYLRWKNSLSISMVFQHGFVCGENRLVKNSIKKKLFCFCAVIQAIVDSIFYFWQHCSNFSKVKRQSG